MNVWIPTRKIIQRMIIDEVKRQLAQQVESEVLHPHPGLTKETSISTLPFSNRIKSIFCSYNIQTISDLCKCTGEDLIKMRNFGSGSFKDVKEFLRQNKLKLGGGD